MEATAITTPRYTALFSDVDHTLLTTAQILTESAIQTVNSLHASNIAFGLISGRPLRGIAALASKLAITAPIAAFNGGILAAPDLSVIREHPIPGDITHRTLQLFEDHGADIWLFTECGWYLRDRNRPHVSHEERTIGFAPTIVRDFTDFSAQALKIVGVSDDTAVLARCESKATADFGQAATVALSPPYHLDITHSLANKGAALVAAAEWLKIPTTQMAAIGDGLSDIAMFERAGLAIAMGNASPEVKARASKVTASCDEDGFAKGVNQFVLASLSR